MLPESSTKIDTCINTAGAGGFAGMSIGSIVLYIQGTAHELLNLPVDMHAETQMVGISTVTFLGAMLAKYMRSKNTTIAPELPVLQYIVERELQFDKEHGPLRQKWIIDHVYLCESGLDVLGQIKIDSDIETSWAHFTAPDLHKGPCKKVVVSLPCTGKLEEIQPELEKLLKLDLHSRGSNAGVFYRLYKDGDVAFSEAVPATLTGE